MPAATRRWCEDRCHRNDAYLDLDIVLPPSANTLDRGAFWRPPLAELHLNVLWPALRNALAVNVGQDGGTIDRA
jgi:hypothetical protein